jgi:copper ion binding protein
MTTDQTRTLSVDGMSCEHCAQSVAEALEGVDGVSQATVDLDAAEATVSLDGNVSHSQLANAVDEAGYRVPNNGV